MSWIFVPMEQLKDSLRYLFKNAYIVVAMDGTPLVTSGKKAFKLISDNMIDSGVMNNVGYFVLFLGKIFVVLITGAVSYGQISVSSVLSSE